MYSPEHLVVEICSKCNYECIMCERVIRKPNKLMEQSVWDLVREGYVPFVPCVELSGLGEPTMHPSFASWALDVQKYGNILYFPTNGSFLTEDKYLDLEDSDRTRVEVSLDASCAENYAKIRKGGVWDTVMANVSAFRKAKPHARLLSTFTAGSYNIDDLPDFIDLAARLGITEVEMRAVRAWALPPEKVSLRFHKDRTEEAIAKAVVRANTTGVAFKTEPVEYAQGFENSGTNPLFVSYLDIVGLGTDPCGGSSYQGGSTSGCYDGKQPILMLDRTHKNAEDIKVGDKLKCVNIWGHQMEGTVSNVRVQQSSVLRIEFVSLHQDTYVETVSPDHLYMCSSNEYIPAGVLEIGDMVEADGGTARVTSIAPDPNVRPVYTWDFAEPQIRSFLTPLDATLKGTSNQTQTTTSVIPEGLAVVMSNVTTPRQRVLKTANVPRNSTDVVYGGVMVVTTGGDICTCGAKHKIGSASQPLSEVIKSELYQRHAEARCSGNFNNSPYCKKCERMM